MLIAPESEPAPETKECAVKSPRLYRAGTLTYTLPGLFVMMTWLLWGDFCFYLMENIVQSVLPIKLGQLLAPNWLIALLVVTIPGLFTMTVNPVVSFWSDRYRSPLGRRIPFILYTIPFLCLFLVLTGLAPLFAEWLKKMGLIDNIPMAAIVLIGIFSVGFQFFNMFVSSVYYYLFNDIVPQECLGRFLAAFRSVGTAAGGIFYFFILPKSETHFAYIFIGAALLYGTAFWMMCRKVKEGNYPPPPARTPGFAAWEDTKTFFRECFTSRYYWLFYLAAAFWAAAGAGSVFLVFFAGSTGVSVQQFGQYLGTSSIIYAILLLPCGALSDKFSPLRTLLTANTVQVGLSALPLVFLFLPIPKEHAFAVWCAVFGLSVPILALFTASELPAYMSILPKEKYGQFSAAASLIRSIGFLTAGLLCGVMVDAIGHLLKDREIAYRFLPFWTVTLQAISAICLWMFYRLWKRAGGPQASRP